MNNKGQLKIADFGLAKYHYVHNTKLTKDVVTSWYRAPELFYGERLYSNAIDIWSVGYATLMQVHYCGAADQESALRGERAERAAGENILEARQPRRGLV